MEFTGFPGKDVVAETVCHVLSTTEFEVNKSLKSITVTVSKVNNTLNSTQGADIPAVSTQHCGCAIHM